MDNDESNAISNHRERCWWSCRWRPVTVAIVSHTGTQLLLVTGFCMESDELKLRTAMLEANQDIEKRGFCGRPATAMKVLGGDSCPELGSKISMWTWVTLTCEEKRPHSTSVWLLTPTSSSQLLIFTKCWVVMDPEFHVRDSSVGHSLPLLTQVISCLFPHCSQPLLYSSICSHTFIYLQTFYS